jgi:hypothetical protein
VWKSQYKWIQKEWFKTSVEEPVHIVSKECGRAGTNCERNCKKRVRKSQYKLLEERVWKSRYKL